MLETVGKPGPTDDSNGENIADVALLGRLEDGVLCWKPRGPGVAALYVWLWPSCIAVLRIDAGGRGIAGLL